MKQKLLFWKTHPFIVNVMPVFVFLHGLKQIKLHQNLAECKLRKILVSATPLLSALHKRQIVMCVYAYVVAGLIIALE